MTLLVYGLTIFGAILLVASLVPVWRLMSLLPPGRARRNWYMLIAVILFFISGYVGYAVLQWNRNLEFSGLFVPAVFFSGACFVWLVNSLSLQTALDMKRTAMLEHENIIDPTMGIYNRRYLERRLKEEVARACRYDLPLSALLLDVDHFKRINDTYGSPAGDLVLNSLGQLIVNTARATDIVARYDADKMLVIAPNTSAASAAKLAERFRETVASYRLPSLGESKDGQPVSVTVSIGAAILVSKFSDSQTLLDSADQALYRAKKEGGNRIMVNDLGPGP